MNTNQTQYTNTILSVSQLEKSYGNQKVLNRLSLQLPIGETIAITGPSGCGKTTLLNLIAGLDQPDQGKIMVDNQLMSHLNEQQRTLLRRQSIGFIFQFFNLIPTLTVVENCLLPLELNGFSNKSLQISAIKNQLNSIGLATKYNQYPEQLSGGEQQRVAIVRALAHQPKLILADEPTGNLDQDTAENVAEFLCEQVNICQCALIMVTHSTALASKADRILHMQNKSLG